MISPAEYIQLKAFARQDGFFVGLLWVFTFACFVASMRSPELQVGFISGMMVSPFIIYFRLRHYRDKVVGHTLSFKRAFAYLFYVIADASIVLAAATFVYFCFIDNGQFMSYLNQSIAQPEVRQSIAQAGMSIDEVSQQLQVFSQTRPIDIAFGIFFNTLLFGLLLALLLSLLCRRAATAKQ